MNTKHNVMCALSNQHKKVLYELWVFKRSGFSRLFKNELFSVRSLSEPAESAKLRKMLFLIKVLDSLLKAFRDTT